MYSLSNYGEMIRDEPRMDAYVKAMRAAIKSGSVVLDLGSGPGLFAFLACQMGARKVYAIESSTAIQIGRQSAVANGFADRIDFFHNISTRVTLPEPADVIVSDLHGPLPLHQQHIPTIRDARQRLLKNGGTLIPQREFLWAAVVDAPRDYEELLAPWTANKYGIDLTATIEVVTNGWIRTQIRPEQLLGEPVRFHVIDYAEVEDPNVTEEVSFSINRSGVAHGVAVWFDAQLFEDVTFSNAPGSPEMIYGKGLFFFRRPVDVSIGDRVEFKLSAHLVRGEYIWSWNTRVRTQDAQHDKADFKQSTFLGSPFSLDQLKKRSANHVPQLNQAGQIQEFVLSQMNGKASLQVISQELVSRFPNWFDSYEAALAQVAELSTDYSE